LLKFFDELEFEDSLFQFVAPEINVLIKHYFLKGGRGRERREKKKKKKLNKSSLLKRTLLLRSNMGLT